MMQKTTHRVGATCLAILLGGIVSRATADDEAARMLSMARQAIADQDRVGAWQAIDLARSNYPEAEPSAVDMLESLDRICSEAQKVGRISVATWRDGKAAAVTLTFDDALASGHRRAAPDLERHGWLGTYFLTDKVLRRQEKPPWLA